jgi:hypothetical protein
MKVVSPKPARPTGTGSASRAASGTAGRVAIGSPGPRAVVVGEAVLMSGTSVRRRVSPARYPAHDAAFAGGQGRDRRCAGTSRR